MQEFLMMRTEGESCARLAMVVHVLEQALSHLECTPSQETPEWSKTIAKESVEKARVILDHIIAQKFALMQPELKLPQETEPTTVEAIPDAYLTKFLNFNKDTITASDVSQWRLMPPSPITPTDRNKYPAKKARLYMERIADAGFGTMATEGTIRMYIYNI